MGNRIALNSFFNPVRKPRRLPREKLSFYRGCEPVRKANLF